MMALDERIWDLGTTDSCTKFHSILFNSCWDITLKTQNVNHGGTRGVGITKVIRMRLLGSWLIILTQCDLIKKKTILIFNLCCLILSNFGQILMVKTAMSRVSSGPDCHANYQFPLCNLISVFPMCKIKYNNNKVLFYYFIHDHYSRHHGNTSCFLKPPRDHWVDLMPGNVLH